MKVLTISVVVPAHNEEAGLADTLAAINCQTFRGRMQVIVADDGSTDRTAEIARGHGATVVAVPSGAGGSKARAQNAALPYCLGDLVLPVDADTVLADDYVERIVKPFSDPRVAIAAGCVLTRHTRTAPERGRMIEYAFGFTYLRKVQAGTNAPVVMSGCCAAFRRSELVARGGFPTRTLVEDFDYTASVQIDGLRAVYVGGAVAYAADPETFRFLWIQVDRWMQGLMQNMRIHLLRAWRHKPMLALWYSVALFEIATMPLWWTTPIWATLWLGLSVKAMLAWWLGVDLALTLPVVVFAAFRRRISPLLMLSCLPFVYANKAVNTVLAVRAMLKEFIQVPLGLSKSMTVYKMGR